MEIIKPGKVKRAKLKCPECGCEFACSKNEMTYTREAVFAECPQDGCGANVEVPIGTTLCINSGKHTVEATFNVVLPMAIVVEEPIDSDKYISMVSGVSREVAEHIKALGADSMVSMAIDGEAPERFYMGDTGVFIAYEPHNGKLYEQ